MRHPKLNMRPPRILYPLQMMWVLWATLACTVLAMSAWILASHILVSPTRSYTGKFESTAQSMPVVLPADVSVRTMMVTEGADIQKGQKLARYDQVALRDLITLKTQKLARNRMQRACLLDKEQVALSVRTLDLSSDDGAGLRDATALSACLNTHRRNRLEREKLMYLRDRLRRQSSLAVQELTARAHATSEPVRSILKLRAALEQIALQTTIRNTEFDLALLTEAQHSTLLESISSLEASADALSADLIRLEALQTFPWLRAPQAGRIERVRDLSGDQPHAVALVLAQIHQTDVKSYAAYFDVPHARANLLTEGAPLDISLAGLPPSQRNLQGIVQSIVPASGAQSTDTRIEIRIPADTLPPTTARALFSLPDGTRSTMRVSLPSSTLSDVLKAASKPLAAAF
ncbi:hypothetical protein NBRC116594_10330 [Shimia sp. NS0008-38b]|uniref:HlyD family efflux transporter periplasmic adaptor subunit n=1 Tax=Shimia sp. NS0008-38b TaxID=3127653 RepID=UPI00310621F9